VDVFDPASTRVELSFLQTVLLITSRHGSHRKHPVSIVVVQLLQLTRNRNVFIEPLRRSGRCLFVCLAKERILNFVLRSFLQPPVTSSSLGANILASALLSDTVYTIGSPGNVKATIRWTYNLMRKTKMHMEFGFGNVLVRVVLNKETRGSY
jgi:hypothetical protein